MSARLSKTITYLLFLFLCLPQFTTTETVVPICPEHTYTIQLFSTTPLIIYIKNFLSKDELTHLQNIDDSQFQPSKVNLHKNSIEDSGSIQSTTRRSKSYLPPRTPPIQCIEQRSLTIQGHGTTSGPLERIQLVKYTITDEYKHHFDWAETSPTEQPFSNRQSTFFVYIEANCTGGGTNFPRLNAPEDERWCEVLDCDEEYGAGVTFRPVVGNAVFWQNLVGGEGSRDTYHAGLAVTSGVKMGMNIFTKERPHVV